MTSKDIKSRKVNIYNKTKELFKKYNKFMIVDMTKISSFQLQFIKHQLKDEIEFLFGKNTTIAFVLKEMGLNEVAKKCFGNIAILFSNSDFNLIRKIFELNKRESHAKVGDIAQKDLWLEPYNTGMPPSMTEFFQALELQTKIEKGSVALITRSQILFEGKKVLPSQANLLKFLNEKPFIYEMKINSVYENNKFYNSNYLYIEDDNIILGLINSFKNLSSLSLGLNLINESTISHQLVTEFNKSIAIGLGLGFELEKLK